MLDPTRVDNVIRGVFRCAIWPGICCSGRDRDYGLVKKLLEDGFIPEIKLSHLFEAVRKRRLYHENIIKLLLEHAVQKYTAMDSIYPTSNSDEWRMKHECDYYTMGHFLLLFAIKSGNVSAIEALLFFGVNPRKAPDVSNTVDFDSLDYSFGNSRIAKYCRIPIDIAFCEAFLPSTIETIIKYAALHIQYDHDEDLEQFFTHFTVSNAIPYRKFAEACVMEVKILKNIWLKSNELTLFDIILLRGNALHQCLVNSEIIENILNVFSSNLLFIYKVDIIRKLQKKYLQEKLLEVTYLKHENDGKETVLNTFCVEHMLSCTEKEELISMWVAYTGM